MELIIASTNRHKFREFRLFFQPFTEIEILSLHDFPDYFQPEENGITFEENAILKATHAAAALERIVLADDSGLVVPALNGAPGVYSRRYAGERATDLENRRKLLKEMSNFQGLERSAYYECALALATPSGLKKCVSGTCQGSILTKERGSNGFGYDALFLKNDYHQSFAQLEDYVKKEISHRAKAFLRLEPSLRNLLAEICL